ncbi:MAG: putative Oxidoreductase with FAD/NAD(P)-binding domain [Acidobacteria bacterium]|nr:putative Oxidoreductase with FAD/NAD(P)-binding domain [Acidobacteriota bacterium]
MYDVVVIGAGAAGLMAAIFAAREGASVVALDGAKRIGAKILISGGGRCNVTHDFVDANDFNGNRNAIGKVLRTFDAAACVAFFAELGVELKREETGKLFPVSDRAKSIIDALLSAADAAGVEVRTDARVTSIERGERFAINGSIEAKRVVLATGGRSVPKTGSDGFGYTLAKRLGHSVTPTFPALVPLVIESGHFVTNLSGTSLVAELLVQSPTGKTLHRDRGSLLFTHFGLSGPLVLDVSRHWIANQPAVLVANLLPGETLESLDAALVAEARANPHATVASFLRRRLPDRLAEALAQGETAASPVATLGRLTKEERRRVVRSVVALPLPIIRDRGFDYAEVTAGGVPLTELDLATMASRTCPGLYLCGEILDVDGRIGGYNVQWAWASGRLAGKSAAR